MSRLLLATALSALSATAALAGGTVPTPQQPPQIVPLPPAADWSGFYGGVQLEYGQGTVDRPPVPGLIVPDLDIDGPAFGVFAGYRTDYGTTVFGVELDLMSADIAASGVPGTLERLVRATLEYGYDAGPALVYGTAGVFGATITPSAPFNDYDWGYVGGVGVDYRIGTNSFIGAELLHHRIDNFSGSGADIDVTTFGVGIAFEF